MKDTCWKGDTKTVFILWCSICKVHYHFSFPYIPCFTQDDLVCVSVPENPKDYTKQLILKQFHQCYIYYLSLYLRFSHWRIGTVVKLYPLCSRTL